MEGTRLAALPGTGAQATAKVCLLQASKGMTQHLTLAIRFPFGNGGVGCGAVAKDFVFDDVQFVNDPTCPATAYLADGGFERIDTSASFESSFSNNGVAAGAGSVTLDTTAANVHGGARALRMVNNVGCGNAAAGFAMAIPPSVAGAGPALQFYYKAPTLTNSTMTVSAGGATSGNLPAAAGYTLGTVCLDPTMAGQSVSVLLGLNGIGSVGCSVIYPTETVWLDDFTVTTSPACPAD